MRFFRPTASSFACPRGAALRGWSFALGLALIACGGRTPLLAPGNDSLAGDDAGSDASVQDVAPASDAAEATAPESSDPCATMPPVPCPGGGHQYCVAGHYSECPRLCGICVPGSTRVCFKTYCSRWGVETCASDGLSFGFCEERSIPSACASIADTDKTSPALEQCCIDNGYCCDDLFDLNGDGNTGDLVGSCKGTSC